MRPVLGIFVFCLLCLTSLASQASCNHLIVDTSAGTVRDKRSNLIWSRCLAGQASSSCFGQAESKSWVDALNLARSASLGGISNWRLPKIEELESIAQSGCTDAVFPGLPGSVPWSASANIDYATDAWAYDFNRKMRIVQARDSRQQIWLVASPD